MSKVLFQLFHMTTSISSSRAHHVGKESGLRNDAVEKPRQAEMPGRQKRKQKSDGSSFA